MQVLLEADVPADQPVASSAMDAARGIVESRVNGLGVAEPVVQAVGGRRVLVELPGIEDPEAAVATLRQTGLMEWVDTGGQYLPPRHADQNRHRHLVGGRIVGISPRRSDAGFQ